MAVLRNEASVKNNVKTSLKCSTIQGKEIDNKSVICKPFERMYQPDRLDFAVVASIPKSQWDDYKGLLLTDAISQGRGESKLLTGHYSELQADKEGIIWKVVDQHGRGKNNVLGLLPLLSCSTYPPTNEIGSNISVL